QTPTLIIQAPWLATQLVRFDATFSFSLRYRPSRDTRPAPRSHGPAIGSWETWSIMIATLANGLPALSFGRVIEGFKSCNSRSWTLGNGRNDRAAASPWLKLGRDAARSQIVMGARSAQAENRVVWKRLEGVTHI